MFLWRVEVSREKPALWRKSRSRFQFTTWKEAEEKVREVALALYGWGVRKGDRVALLSENRPEWAFVDLGILSIGAATVPIYPTGSVKECHYILEHAETSLVFVSNQEQFEKVKPLLDQGSIKTVVKFDEGNGGDPRVWSWESWLEWGRKNHLNNGDLFRQLVRRVLRDDLATVIYTSGTTGPPKGVMLTHGNFLSNCEAASAVLPLGERERALSFLPLSHVFERMAGYYFMILNGVSIAYAESMQTVPEDLRLVRPTVAAAVPRFYEKTFARISEAVQQSAQWKKRVFNWAIKVGARVAPLRSAGQKLPAVLASLYRIAQFLVFRKIKRGMGGRIRFFISGGAPLAKELAEFFYAADILILEGYGLTETSPVITVNRLNRFKFGTVGLPLPRVEVKIAPDGEVLTRGPHIMKGYFKNEDATREAIREGWFYTGDLGEIDAEGFLKITGRKKDLIITAGGKNISPQNIEGELLKDPFFSQVVVLGDRRPYLVALIVPNRSELARWAEERGLSTEPWEKFLKQSPVKEFLSQRIGDRIKDFASYEQVKYFHLLPRELTQDSGELTPTLKIKRRVVMDCYASEIEALYQKGEAYAKTPQH